MDDDRLKLVKKFFYQKKRLPSYSEMLDLFGLKSKKAIYDIVHRWINLGFLEKAGRKISPTPKFFSLPVLGVIKAGFPILAEENKEYLSLDDYLIEDPNSSFLLKVSGDSLINLGIFDGDMVVIKRVEKAYYGSIVLAEIDGEWTLKILKKDNKRGRLYLEAANPNYPKFYPKRQLKVFGVVNAVIRKLNRVY